MVSPEFPVKIRHDLAGQAAYLQHLTYDGVYRLVHDWGVDAVGTLYDAAYAYDAVGNRTQETRDGSTRYYTCDDNDKLTKMGTTAGGSDLATFGYDNAGNMTSVAAIPGTPYEITDSGNSVDTIRNYRLGGGESHSGDTGSPRPVLTPAGVRLCRWKHRLRAKGANLCH